MSTEGERVVEVDCAPTQHAVRQAKRDLGGDVTDGRSDGCHQDGVEALEKSLAGEDHDRAALVSGDLRPPDVATLHHSTGGSFDKSGTTSPGR